MIFSSLQFLVFFVVVYILYLFLKNKGRIYYIFLLIASYYFYMSWNPAFIIVLIFTTLLDYTFGRKIQATEDDKKRRRYVVLSIAINLGLLGVFKYTNFFIENINHILSFTGSHLHRISKVDITLPVGISFFTFKSMSYTIDIYRRNMKAEPDLIKFGVFVGFFPELVAGPIVRAEKMLPQLHREVSPTVKKFISGLKLFTIGFFKKLFIADMISPYSDNVFAHIAAITPYEAWIGIIAYSIQIYCDFSGYTDMAIGVARMLDYNFPENFNLPYTSKSITEFWRRWHISLSSWFFDYLYSPIVFSIRNRGSIGIAVTIALFLTFFLSGLWHGAGWTYVLFGTLHGIMLIIHYHWMHVKKKLNLKFLDKSPIWNFLAWASTLFFVINAWVFFRAPNFTIAKAFFAKLYSFQFKGIYYTPQFYFLLTLVIGAHIIYPYLYDDEGKFKRHPFIETLIYAYMIIMLILLAPTHTSPFIYFQF